MKISLLALAVYLSISIFSQAWADGNHSPLLMLISNKLKIEELISKAEEAPSTCSKEIDKAWALMQPSLHMLREYTQEKEGNYLSQQSYASSLEQRAKTLNDFSILLDRLFHLKETCFKQ